MKVYASNYMPLSYAYGAGASGRVSVPVAPSQLVYSYFKHVAGTAVPDAAPLAIDKLKILDTLIERLRGGKNKLRETTGKPDDKRIDALIEQYSRELHAQVVSNNAYSQARAVTPGLLVSFAA